MPDDDVIGFTEDTDPNDDDRLYMGVDISGTPLDKHVRKDNFLGRRTFKDSVRLATESNDTLSGLAARDGITPIANDRVLVKAQSAGAANGIYLAAAGAWTRAKDFDTSPKATSGAFMVVQEGTANADKLFQLTTNEPITLATTALVFTEFVGGGNVSTTTPNTYDTGQMQTFHSGQFQIRNPADTFAHIFIIPASGLNRNITFPDAGDTLMGKNTTDIMLNKTFDANGTGNVITNIENADIAAAAAIAFSKLASLVQGNILVGSVGGVATSVNPTGDINIAASGLFSINAGVVIDADISASAAIAFSKLATLTSGNLLVGSSGNVVTSVNPTGDIDISNTGVFSINAGVIVTADIGDNQVTFAKTQDIATNRLLGRNTAATGAIEELTHDATLEFNVLELRRAAITGDITIAVGSNAAVFGAGVIVDADVNASAAIVMSKITGTSAQFDTANSDGTFFLNADNISAMAASTVAQFNTALTGETFAFIGVANAWGTINQNIAATGKWQEAGVNISPIGIHDIPVGATAMYVTTNTPATGLTLTNFATGDIDLQTFDFTSTAADETVQFRTPMPRNYNNGAITVTINWSQASGTGNVVWRIGAVARGQSEAIGLAFTYSADLVDAAGTANQVQSTTTASFTPAGTPVDDDELHFEVQRQGSDALDTFTGTARLHSIVIHITTDAATAA